MPDDALEPTDRGAPLVATWTRWAVSAAALGVAFAGVVEAYIRFTHVDRTLASFAWLIAAVCVTEAVLVLAILRAEESRLTRELRTARTGTAVLRGLVARRRQQTPFLARLFATNLGLAAVFLADGDRDAALDVFRRTGDVDAAKAALETTDLFIRAKEEAMILGYAARWGKPTGVIAIEQTFRVPLVNPETGASSRTFSLGGRVDAIVEAEAVAELINPA